MQQGQPSNSTSRRARRNITRACEECRRRRTKCNGARPKCSRCLDHSTHCNYGVEEDGRKPASKFYVEALRARINLLEKILELHSIDIEAGVATLREKSAFTDLNTASALTKGDTSAAEMQELQMAFEGTLSLEDSLNFEQDGEARYFGPTSSRLEFRSAADHSISPDHLTESPSYDSPASMAVAPTSNDFRAELYARMRAADTEHNIPEELKVHLIELFFAWQAPWYHVVDEALFMESRRSNGRYYSPLLECCILAFGSRFTDKPEVRSDPDDASTAGKVFYEKAEIFLPFDLKFPTLTTIQSLALLSSLHVAFGSDSACWLSQGMAYRLAIDMGLNLDAASLAGSNVICPQEIELRRNIYWALYCDDKLAAAYTGRVCALPECHASVNLPSVPPPSPDDEDGEDNQNPWAVLNNQSLRIRHSALLHRCLISLCQIIEKILLSLYAPKPQCRGGKLLVFFESCSLELNNWLYDLPVEMRSDRLSPKATLPHAYTLLMVYHTAWILLAIPFLKRSSVSAPHDEINTYHRPTREPNITTLANAKLGNSARQICSIARKYRRTFGSFRLSALSATHSTLTAAVALLRISPNGENLATSLPQSDLTVCLEVLDELSVSWGAASKLRQNLVQLIARRRTDQRESQDDTTYQADDTSMLDSMDFAQAPVLSHNLQGTAEIDTPQQFPPPFPFDMGNPDLLPNINWDQLDLDELLGSVPQ